MLAHHNDAPCALVKASLSFARASGMSEIPIPRFVSILRLIGKNTPSSSKHINVFPASISDYCFRVCCFVCFRRLLFFFMLPLLNGHLVVSVSVRSLSISGAENDVIS